MKESVDMILLAMNDLKWQELRDMLLAFGEEQYRLGFLDGEASVAKAAPAGGCGYECFGPEGHAGSCPNPDEPLDVTGVCV